MTVLVGNKTGLSDLEEREVVGRLSLVPRENPGATAQPMRLKPWPNVEITEPLNPIQGQPINTWVVKPVSAKRVITIH